MLAGLAIYYGYSKQHETDRYEEETPTVVQERQPSQAETKSSSRSRARTTPSS